MAGHPAIRLLLADVDGTLVTQKKLLTDKAIAAVSDLKGAGIQFAITSGRPPRGMTMLIEPLALTTPIAGFNGGVMTGPDLKVIDTRTLPPNAAHMALSVILDQGLDAWVYTADQWLIRDRAAAHVAHEAETVQFEAIVVPDFTGEHLSHAVKIVGVSDDLGLVAACEKAAQDKLGGNATAARSQPYYLDITHRDANKGAVVERLSEMLKIPREAIATIGDQPNDTLIFARSGLSIAMGNSSDAVKAKADEVTGSNEEEGFAQAVRRFILPLKSL